MTTRALSLFKEKVYLMNRVKEFMTIKNLFLGADYVWGSENLEECDCSGLICGTLTLMGNKIRINAEDIRQILTRNDNQFYDESKVKLGFFISPENKAKHVGIITDNSLFCHASYPKGVAFEDLNHTINRYNLQGYTFEKKMLDFDKVDEHTGLIYDLDEELS